MPLTQHLMNWPLAIQKEPPPLDESELLSSVPLWLILQVAKGRDGKRGRVYPKYCAYPNSLNAYVDYTGFGGYSPTGSFSDEASDEYPPGPVNTCGRPWPKVGNLTGSDHHWQPQDSAKTAREKRYRRMHKPSEKREVGPGNLTNHDYGLWIGDVDEKSHQRRCRWCHSFFQSRDDGLGHYINGQNCGWFLRQLYKFSKHHSTSRQKCMVCEAHTVHQIWGVWLCDNRACIRAWKFGQPSTHVGFRAYRTEAMAKDLLWNL